MGKGHSRGVSLKRVVRFIWPRRSKQAVREITREGLEKEWAFNTFLLASAFKDLACDIHEDCDGSCQDVVTYPDPPLLGEMGLFVPMLMQAANRHPSGATPKDVPRDTQWVEGQKFLNLEYSPINSPAGEIRLMRVRKGILRSDVIECDRFTTNLGQCGNFQALSYCCGSDKMVDVMLCNGKKRYIQPSLNAALKTFRESLKLKDQLLWTDGICIDEVNKAEVGEQILLMRKIYTEATGVFVHLGLAERRMSQGLDLMLRLNGVQQHLRSPEEFGSISLDDVKLPPAGDRCWEEYYSLYLSPWISRTWILQEIALSQKATLGIGRYVTDWAAFERSFHFVREQGLLERVMMAREGLMMGFLNFTMLQEIRRVARSRDDSSLLKVLRTTRNFKVTDPRDKILGVLGIAGDIPTRPKDVSDYRLSTSQNYHKTALYLLEVQFPQDILAHAGLQRRVGQLDMPSWVPDWYADATELNERPLNLFRPAPFLAGGRPNNCCLLKAEDTLYPRAIMSPGVCHDRIIRTSDAFNRSLASSDDGPTTSQTQFAWIKSARACLQESDDLIYNDVEEAFARTLLVDDLYSGSNAIRAMAAIKDLNSTLRATLAQLEHSTRKEVDRAPSWHMQGTSEDQLRTCNLQMLAAMRARRFAITDTGYMCLVPSCTQVGDVVAIFFGFPTPFTIRLEPNSESSEGGLKRVRAQLVGDTYMHGAMYAESFPEAMSMGRLPCEIVLV